MATAPRTAAPRPRRTHWPTPGERFIATKTRPPTRRANASDVAAPAAQAASRNVVWTAGALKGCFGQDQAENRSGTGGPLGGRSQRPESSDGGIG